MTLLEINLTDVLSETDPDDRVLVWAPAFREGATGGLVGPRQKVIPLVDGVGSDEVVPGPLMVQVRCKAMSDTHPREVVVPEEGPVTLTGLLDSAGAFTYAPPVIGQVAQLRDEAVQAVADAEDAADRAENVAASVYWQDDRLSVMGVLGPSLRGPKGDPGDGTGGGAGDVLWSELNPVLDGKAGVSHDHTIASITGLQDELGGKAPASHQHSWGDVTGKPSTYPPESHSHPSTAISDSTSTGRAVLAAADAAAARGVIGAGTSNLALGTTSTTAKAGNYQPTAANITDATTVGRNVLKAADAAAARTAIGAGTSSLALGSTSSTAAPGNHTHSQYAESSRVTTLEGSQPIIVSSLPPTPLPGRIYLVTG